ncbi:DUF481 domain-containing protein [Rubrivirga sp.]|uniref:DUF481 domain-containing protein n=1 Tax=Rubrivirga sp. TaxID=1885344 RepID=UPI003B52DA02
MRLALLVLLAASASAQVNTERMRRQLADDGLFVTVDAAASLATGNTDFLQIGLGGWMDLRFGENTAFLIGRLDLAQSDERAFVDQSFAHVRHNRTLAPRVVAESFVQVQRNRQERLDTRALLGAGLRVEVVQRDSLGLAVGVTPMFEREVLDEALGGTQDAVGRVSSYVAGRVTLASGTALTATTYVQPRVSAPGDLRVLSQLSLDVGLTRFLKLRIRADLRYDSRPPPEVETTDLRIENGLVFVFPAG